MAKCPFNTVDEYINSFDEEMKQKLTQLRMLIKQNAPKAEEKLAWGAPSYYLNGFLLQFAGCKNHIGFYTTPTTIQYFEEELKSYKTNSKNTMQIPVKEPLPLGLLSAMIQFRVNENQGCQVGVKGSKKKILETDRLYLREMEQDDFEELCKILKDSEVMYAYEHAFSDGETQQWLNNQLKRYEEYGFGLWAVVLKETGEMIGQCGLTMQDGDGKEVLEVGYLFQKAYWHKGYATEAAVACKKYAFDTLKAEEVYSIIRDNNIASQNVAKRNGMTVCGKIIKHYYGMDMPHLLFSVKRQTEI